MFNDMFKKLNKNLLNFINNWYSGIKISWITNVL